jgi:hypothetical protein
MNVVLGGDTAAAGPHTRHVAIKGRSGSRGDR